MLPHIEDIATGGVIHALSLGYMFRLLYLAVIMEVVFTGLILIARQGIMVIDIMEATGITDSLAINRQLIKVKCPLI